MRLEDELGHHTKWAASSASDRPEEVLVLGVVRGEDVAFGCDDCDLVDIVGGEAIVAG